MDLRKISYKLINLLRFYFNYQENYDKLKTNQGLIFFNSRAVDSKFPLSNYGLSIFSQFDEDGLIDAIIQGFNDLPNSFIEFGVDDFSEANCRFLTESLSWKGAIFEGNKKAFSRMTVKNYYWKKNLSVFNKFLNIQNIESSLLKSNFKNNLGILSVDVDGNDFYLLEKSLTFEPSIIIVEYNSLFGFKYPVSIPYDSKFDRLKAHKSGLYYGAGLKAFEYLLNNKGYQLVGTNAGGNNAFFVKESSFKFKNWFTESKVAFKKCIFNESRLKDVSVHNINSLPKDLLELPLHLVDTNTKTTVKEVLR